MKSLLLFVTQLYSITLSCKEPIGKPVILQHGLFGSSSDWVITEDGPYLDEIRQKNDSRRIIGNNLGFELALAGYDVWLSNSRGNRYTDKKHRFRSISSAEYWDFSMEQKIDYDVPATIDYVLAKTGYKTVGWVGHSQGTMIMFGLLSTNRKYNEIIKPFIALAPVSSIGNAKGPIRLFKNSIFNRLASTLRGKFGITSWFTRLFARNCPSNIKSLCANPLFMIVGSNAEQFDHSRIEVYLR